MWTLEPLCTSSASTQRSFRLRYHNVRSEVLMSFSWSGAAWICNYDYKLLVNMKRMLGQFEHQFLMLSSLIMKLIAQRCHLTKVNVDPVEESAIQNLDNMKSCAIKLWFGPVRWWRLRYSLQCCDILTYTMFNLASSQHQWSLYSYQKSV